MTTELRMPTVAGRLIIGALLAAPFPVVWSSPAAGAASEAECGQFHEECTAAKAVGSHDAGICKVERLECTFDPSGEPGARQDAQRPPQSGVHDAERRRP